MRISVIVPTYNEARFLARVIEAVLGQVDELLEVIVVDDGSTDCTDALMMGIVQKQPSVRYVCLERNRGKSHAVRVGIEQTSGEIVVVQDADLEYDPGEINDLVAPIRAGLADLVLGSRFLVRKAARTLYFRHYLANKFITFLSNVFTDFNLTDVETGYKAMRGELIRSMRLTSQRFGFEIEVVAKAAKLKSRVFEVPISYYGRSYEDGKKIRVWDGLMAVFYVFKYNLFTTRKGSIKPGGEQDKQGRSEGIE